MPLCHRLLTVSAVSVLTTTPTKPNSHSDHIKFFSKNSVDFFEWKSNEFDTAISFVLEQLWHFRWAHFEALKQRFQNNIWLMGANCIGRSLWPNRTDTNSIEFNFCLYCSLSPRVAGPCKERETKGKTNKQTQRQKENPKRKSQTAVLTRHRRCVCSQTKFWFFSWVFFLRRVFSLHRPKKTK